MEYLGEHFNRKVYWWDYATSNYAELPADNWVCLAMADEYPGNDKFSEFVDQVIEKGILEFKGHGKYGEQLHDVFDEITVDNEINKGYPESEIMTTWHNNQTIADVFWQCFYATCLPDETDYNNVKIVCVDFDNKDKRQLLIGHLQKFEQGWLPSDND